MKLGLFLNDEKIIIAKILYENYPEEKEDAEIRIEVDETTYYNIQLNRTKYINGQFDFSENDDEITKMNIRLSRQEYCFDIVNRGQLWYDTLTNEQKEELRVWYQGWLYAPETLIVPNKPEWL